MNSRGKLVMRPFRSGSPHGIGHSPGSSKPTLLSLLDFSYDSEFFGRDALGENAAKKPRALIANYQSLGLFENDILTVLEPKKVQYQIIDPLGAETISTISQPQLLRQTIALYQSADYVFRHGLSRVRTAVTEVASRPADTADKDG